MITMQTITAIGLIYLIGINLAGFIIMGVDKKRAIRGAWRISEASLFLTALLGGSLGCILGMQHFRHKTKHWYFKYGMPAILVVQVLLFILLYIDVIYAVIMSYHREFFTSIITGIKIELYFIKNRTCNLHTCISRTGRMNTGSSQHIPR